MVQQWRGDPGATAAVFQLTPAYQGKQVSVGMIFSKLNYWSELRTSEPVDYSVTAWTPIPVISGVVAENYTLSVSTVGTTPTVPSRVT